MDREQASSLNWLRWHWGSAYVIELRGNLYTATRRDDSAVVMTAVNAILLRERISADYQARPVPR